MPVLLKPDQAPALRDLLAQANTSGLDCRIVAPEGGGADPVICGLGSLCGASSCEISFLSNPKLSHQLKGCAAAAVVMTNADYQLTRDAESRSSNVVRFSHPYLNRRASGMQRVFQSLYTAGVA